MNTERHDNPPKDSASDATGMAPADVGRGTPRWRSVLLGLLKWGLFLVVIYFVGANLIAQLRSIAWRELDLHVGFVLLATGCAILSRGLDIVTWRYVVACFHRPPGWLAMLTVAWIPMLGKYLPGKAATVVGAVWLLRREGVPTVIGTRAVLTQVGLVVILGLLLAVPITLWGPVADLLGYAWLWCVLLIAGGLVCLHPKVFAAAANFLLRRLGREPLVGTPRLRDYVRVGALLLVGRALAGVTLWCACRSLAPVSADQIPLLIAAMALATTSGFLAFFAPAGLGVREHMLQLVLRHLLASSAVVVVGMRLLYTLVEVALAGVGMLVLRHRGVPGETTADPTGSSAT